MTRGAHSRGSGWMADTSTKSECAPRLAGSLAGEIEVPTVRERQAHLLRERQGLSDEQIAGVLGCSRETANRWRSAYRRKYNALRLICLEGPCALIERLNDARVLEQVAVS